MTKKLEGKIALITGASKGIGAAVAKNFAREGAHVILVARNVGALEEVDDEIKKLGGKATLVPLDLLDFDKIDSLGAQISKRFGKLDILIGNAAMLGQLSPMPHIDPKVWEKTIGLNVTANFRLIRSLDALLKQSDAAKVAFVTSGVTKRDAPFWGAYAVSKIALEKIVGTYAAESQKTNMKIGLIDPGVVATNMRAQAMPGEDPSKLTTAEEISEKFLNFVNS